MLIASLVVAILILLLLAAVFIGLSFLSGEPHPPGNEFSVATPSFQLPEPGSESSDLSARNPEVPDAFNPSRIKADLAVLAGRPTLLGQYIARAELRFTQGTQIDVLAGWTRFYNCGKEVIVARTELARAHNDFLQVNRESEIKAKQKEVEMAKLDADKEEHETRKARTVSDRDRLRTPGPPKSEDDVKMSATQERDRRDIRYNVRRSAGTKLSTLRELHQWFKEERQVIFADDALTPEEQDEQYSQLQRSYNDYKTRLNVDVGIYEDDE